MKKLKDFTFRTQIFLTLLVVIIIPIVLLCAWAAGKSASSIIQEYNTSAETLLTQTNQTLDTLLQDALRIADTPLLNDEVKKSMLTDYGDDYLSYAQDSTYFRGIMRQTNRLSSSMLTVVFQSRYGYSFEYNIQTVEQEHQAQDAIAAYTALARASRTRTYFAPLRTRDTTGQSVLPMLKILVDGYSFREIGVCYGEINFEPIADILDASRDTQNTLLIFNSDNALTWSTKASYLKEADQNREVLDALFSFSASLTEEDDILQTDLKAGSMRYTANGCINSTTGWRLVQLVDNDRITHVYRDTYTAYIPTFALCALLGLILSIFLSRFLSRPISRLCRQIDLLDPADGVQIDLSSCGSNRELRRLVDSFNRLSRRLTDSLWENYQTQITEQQVRVQMLQFQINHHFLYNTLNIIKSLAGIHNVPEIGTIATCMSDLIRYNLKNFPVAPLSEELRQVQRYMTIQNIRFPGKFVCDINIPPEFLNMKLPVFLFQPLVENSIEHGFASRESDCYISISCQIDGDRLHFLVADNGAGIPARLLDGLLQERREQKTHTSIGLWNVSQRLKSYYGPQYGLSIDSRVNEGTIVDIILPKAALHMNPQMDPLHTPRP